MTPNPGDAESPPESEPDSDSIQKLREFQQRAETQQTTASERGPKKLETVLKAFGETIEARRKTPEQLAESERLYNERCRQQLAMERENRWQTFVNQVGKRYAQSTIGGYVVDKGEVQRRAVDRVCAFAEAIEQNVQEGRNLVFYGPPGTGKDHLAIAVCRRALAAGFRCVAVDGQRLFQAAREAIAKETSEDELLKPYLTADVLLISDPIPPLDSAKGLSDFQLATLWRIIDGRYREMRSTFVTINVATREEMDKRLVPNIADRLIDGALVVVCKWGSYRKSGNP